MKKETKLPDIGSKFDHWEVLDHNIMIKHKKKYINCKCSCGRESYVGLARLIRGKTKSCAHCSPGLNKQNLGKGSHRGVGLITRSFYGHIKHNCSPCRRGRNRGNIEFTITIEEMWELFVKQEGKCALTGIDLVLYCSHIPVTDKKYYSYITASLDRIDSNKGYTLENVQWVHKWINIMKNTLNNEQFIYLCNLVSNNTLGNFEPSLVNTDFLEKVTRKVQRLIGEDAVSNNPDTSARHPTNEGDDIV